MVRLRVVQLVLLACCCLSNAALEDYVNYLLVEPEAPRLQIGTNFSATCLIRNSTEVTADDLMWRLANEEIPKEQYQKINDSALNVTITITEQTPPWLFCFAKKDSASVKANSGKYYHGIYLKKGYLPVKPRNLTCMAVQDEKEISSIIHCEWEPKLSRHWDLETMYRLNLHIFNFNSFNTTTKESSADIDTGVFPNFMLLDIWVEAYNEHGKVASEHLVVDPNSLTKPNPPDVNIISEDSLSSTLLLNWKRPIDKTVLQLIYQIRYIPEGALNWNNVPPEDTSNNIESFRLQNLRPDTVYIIQVRCKHVRDGYWSEWSNNATKKTPEDKPKSKPDVWQILTESEDGRQVQLLSKEPELANGQIRGYKIKIQDFEEKRQNKDAEWETIPVTSIKTITPLKRIRLTDETPVIAQVIAFNSKGDSPEATIVIPENENGPAPVQRLNTFSNGSELVVEWSTPNSTGISEYLIQWTSSSGAMNWQREKRNIRKTKIRGNIEKFVRYSVSVYPLYYGWIGKPVLTETYLEQDVPLEGPHISITHGCTEAHLRWEKIPVDKQRGFITNYTIFYFDGTKTRDFTVPSSTYSYTLKNLSRGTTHKIWVSVSNIKGSTDGPSTTVTTLKYEPGELEGIVVAVSLGFLFVVVLTMLICVCKRDVIKKSFWPEIPNPGESTIGSWAPDYPLKVETPSENGLSGISVLDVDVCDGKSVFEEDKSCLPLKKDKYMSEEHSSGIGGSSCMSSPRQSVSDSDEGGDMADTTASTVQYSSVVASSGYKGQTPCLQPQQAVFSRSESTQPLLESEENPDMLSLEGSRQSQRFSHVSLSRCEGSSETPNLLEMEATGQKALEFCPVEEDSEEMTSADCQPNEWSASGPISSYMPQLGGYRPQEGHK